MLEAEKGPWGGREEWDGFRIEEKGSKIGNKILGKYQNTVEMAEKENKGKNARENKEEEINHLKDDLNNQDAEETEKERENRIRHERREIKSIQKEVNLKYTQKGKEEHVDRMTRGTYESDITMERQSSEKKGKRKLEADKEENRRKKGRENEEQSPKERSPKQVEGKTQEVSVREIKIIENLKGKENNANTTDLCEWKSNREEYLITISLNKEKMSLNKKGNLIKIYNILLNTGIKFDSIKMVGFNRAEVKYKNRQDANRILEESRLKPEGYTSYIPPRWKERKGVIHEWEGTIEDLRKQLAPDQGTFTLEKLKKRKIKEGKTTWEEGKAILIRMRGDSLPTKIIIGWGHVYLRIEPFVEAVKQCFKCLRFGHVQAVCKTPIRKCFVCTTEAHGRCEDKPKCINCGGEHLSMARECQTFQRESAIKKIMAYKNLSYNTAHEIIRKEEKISKFGERYVGEEEESEDEEKGDRDFPTIKRNRKKVEYWENLPIPIEKERGRWNGAWGRNKEQMTHGTEEEGYREDQATTRERSSEQHRGRYKNEGDKKTMTIQNKKTADEEAQQKKITWQNR